MLIWFLFVFVSFTRRFSQVSSPVLKSLAPGVDTALVSSIAPSTAKSYFSLFKKWKLWCTQFSEVNYFPADDTYIALYLVNLLQSGFCFSTIQSAYYAIAFFHRSCGLSKPCDSSFLKAVLLGCKRPDARKSHVSRQRSLILPEHLDRSVSPFACRFVGFPF